MSRMRMHVLASGSKGNATIIEDGQTGRALLIDCGISKRDFFDRCKEAGVNLAKIEGILITHEHTDHTKGLGVVTRGLAKEGIRPPLYTSPAIRRASGEIIAIQESCEIRTFERGDQVSIAGMSTHVFETSHDAVESFGFRIESARETLGYMTDTGIVLPAALEALTGCHILAIESNHDKRMLESGPYPYILKQRVASDKGHLSNAQSTDALESLLCPELKHVVALHISENNNTYRLPGERFAEALKRHDHSAQVWSSFQHRVVSV